ncbi:hypothetical protein BpHYR1_054618 [Brachionus plicatilis]|uniref:Secreted protein n=1 Tax=Brachionus plicatilis TaxID=10195 RepID=A0A3M7QZ49_BRAPC|nr:hypothetical protein BpHYR1_054618 [Brachionus plicatilis]
MSILIIDFRIWIISLLVSCQRVPHRYNLGTESNCLSFSKAEMPSTMSSSSKCSSSLHLEYSFSFLRLFKSKDCSIRALSY